MTDINRYNPYPDTCTVSCPTCSGSAAFQYSFLLFSQHEKEAIEEKCWPCSEVCRWGNWYVLETDPSLYKWKDPHEGHRRTNWGVVFCAACGSRFKHELKWPDDAFYKIDHKGAVLWAWSDGHVKALIGFIGSKDRNAGDYKGYYLFLRHIPTAFLEKNQRPRIVAKLSKIVS